MSNLISIVEIPTTDLARAIDFYQTILGVEIEKATMGDTEMGVIPADSDSVNVVLINGSEYKPAEKGTLIYLNGGDDLRPMLNRAATNGGQIVVPKTEISPGMGYFAIFIDSEGNRVGLHSAG